MMRLSPLLALSALLLTSVVEVRGQGRREQLADFSVVKVFFVDHNPVTEMRAMGDPQIPVARAGNVLGSPESFRPISIWIDDEFVGHAMEGFAGIKPTFHLQQGTHKFRIQCEGYEPIATELRALGRGSQQWLVVDLRPKKTRGPAQ